MSLRIRRGTDAQRQQITPDEGELIFTTNTQKLYMGDGITQGGVNIGQTLAGTGLVFDVITQTLQATGGGNQGGGGILSVSADLNPALGGNLNLNSRNITGTGNIDINGTIKTTGLGANLSLNSFNITGTGNINIVGTLSVSGLGTDLSITGRSIIGSGNINTTGTLGVTGLSKDLALGGFNVTGTGNIGITGNIVNTGNVTTTGNITGTIVGNGLLTLTDQTLSAGASTVLITSSNALPVRVKGITAGTFSGSLAALSLSGSKGTLTAPTNTAAGDVVSQFTMEGYYNGAYKSIGSILGSWMPNATLTDTQPKSTLTVTVSGGGSTSQYFQFIGDGGVFYAPILQPGSYAGSGAYPFAPTGVGGAIIYDSVTNHFMGWNGTIWKQIDN